uniref:Uncharacterized protein n=1 Tax=Arundo donax TaxID=35708 RepID=A0A0A9HSD0_ARUDO
MMQYGMMQKDCIIQILLFFYPLEINNSIFLPIIEPLYHGHENSNVQSVSELIQSHHSKSKNQTRYPSLWEFTWQICMLI